MKWIVPILTFTSLAISAQAEITPEARAIIDAYNTATGGTEAKEQISRVHFSGRWEMPEQGIAGKSELWIENNKSFAMFLDVPEFGTMKTLSTQGYSWTETPSTGVKKIDEESAPYTKRMSCLFPELDIDKNYQSATVQESSDLEKVALRMIDHDGQLETWIFDRKTSFLVEVRISIDEGVRGSFTVSSSYGDYREIGGIWLPNSIIQKTSVFELNISTEAIELNPIIPNHVFQLPDEFKSAIQ